MHINLCKQKENMLSSVDDTCFSETEDEYFRKVTDFGFKSLLIEPFKNKHGIEERLHIMFHYDYSILLAWDTFTWEDDGSWAKSGKSVPPPSRNGGKFYYNWSPNEIFKSDGCLSSGGYINNGDKNHGFSCLFNKDLTPHILPDYLRIKEPKWNFQENNWNEYQKLEKQWSDECKEYVKENNLISIWSGDHDCREALKHNINKMLENGTFIKKWKEQPFLWLLYYMDSETKNFDYKLINKTRISKLPIEVQELIRGNK